SPRRHRPRSRLRPWSRDDAELVDVQADGARLRLTFAHVATTAVPPSSARTPATVTPHGDGSSPTPRMADRVARAPALATCDTGGAAVIALVVVVAIRSCTYASSVCANSSAIAG